MASLTGQTISSTYDGLLKTVDNDVLGATAKEITDGLGNGSGVALDTAGNVTIEGNFQAQGGVKDTSGNLGTSGQVLKSTGTGTNWGAADLADDSVTYAKLGTEFTTSAALATNVDFATAQVFTKTLSGATTLTFSNTEIGMVKDLVITGDFALTLPAGSTVAGTYDGTVSNLIQVVVTGASQYWFSISQAQ